MNLMEGQLVRISSEIENLLGGREDQAPKLGMVGAVDSKLEFHWVYGVTAYEIIFNSEYEPISWWVPVIHLEKWEFIK